MLVGTLAIAFVGGLFLASSFVIDGAWPGVFLGVAAFVLVGEWSRRTRDAVVASLVFGACGYIGGYHWLAPALVAFSGGHALLSWTVWAALGAWVSFRFLLIMVGYRALRRRRCNPILALVLPWLTIEWLYPTLFPFYLANPLIDHVWLAQLAAFGGPLLVSAIACVASVWIVEAALRVTGGRGLTRRALVSSGVLIVGAVALGAWSATRTNAMISAAPTITVGVVQANVDVVSGRSTRMLAHRRYLELSRELESEGPLGLLVWPETAYFAPLPDVLPLSGAIVRDDLEAPLLFGGVVQPSTASDHRFNSALLVGIDGTIRSANHKRYLIPFAEYVPLSAWWPAWARPSSRLGRFAPGEPTDGLMLDGAVVAVPICYEAIRPGYVRALVRRMRPSLLVTLANDGWFEDSPEPSIHLRLSRLRAVEHRRYLVRATNTGISAIVDPLGRVVARTPLAEVATLRGEVRLLEGQTPYGIAGDWPGYASLLVMLWLLAARRPT